MKNADVEQVIALLERAYGKRAWNPNHDPLGTLVRTILSQNTSDVNSNRAYNNLRAAFPCWEDAAEAQVKNIADAIRIGGLGDIKAARIKAALKEIERQRGRLELDFLGNLPMTEARDWLMHLNGVGYKTANIVLLFALGKPALPVDTHVFRVSKRLGLVAERTSVEQAHHRLEALVPPEDAYRFHVLVIEHGRRTCKAQRPRCGECALAEICPSYSAFMSLYLQEEERK